MTPELSLKIRNVSYISICAIVLLHSYNAFHIPRLDAHWAFLQLFIQRLTRFAVPLFFMISAFLFANGAMDRAAIRQKWQRRIHTLLIPLVICSLVILAFDMALTAAGLQRGSINLLSLSTGYHLWFVQYLIVLCLAAPFLFRCMKSRYSVLIPAAAYAACIVFGHFANRFLVYGTDALFYYCLGLYLRHHGQEKFLAKRLPTVWLVSAAIVWTAVNGFVAAGKITHPLLPAAANLLGIVVVWGGYDRLIRTKKELPGSRNSFFIYLYHTVVLKILAYSQLFVLGRVWSPLLVDAIAMTSFFLNPVVTVALLNYTAQRIGAWKIYRMMVGNRI